MAGTGRPRYRSRAAATALVRSVRRASAARRSAAVDDSESPNANRSIDAYPASPGVSVFSTTARARSIRDSPSASEMPMLRDTSTSTGTTTAPEGGVGSSTTGRHTKIATAARARARRPMSVARWIDVSGTSGRRYERKAIAPMPIATSRAIHQGMGKAKTMLAAGRLLLFLPRGECLEITVDLLLIGGGRLIVGAGRQAVLGVTFLQLLGQRRLDLLERRAHMPFHLLPLRKILFERLGAGR